MEMVKYSEKLHYEKWDKFVMDESVNGTFLQTRKFLSYHSPKRFLDCSFLLQDKNKVIAVCPACEEILDGKKVFISHKGSTYGGVIVSSRAYKTEKMIQILDVIEQYLKEQGFKKILYKITPDIFCSLSSDLLCFCLNCSGYKEHQELSFYIDYGKYNKEIIRNFNRNKTRLVNNGLQMGMYEKLISQDKEIKQFYELLCQTLKKFNVTPVHTYEEILLLRKLLNEELEFIGIYLEKKMVAGAMLFYFKQTKCMHVQYSASDPSLLDVSPMSFLYYSIIKHAMELKCRYLSWGIATDHDGNLNMGLVRAKEAVGSSQAINRVFEKEL